MAVIDVDKGSFIDVARTVREQMAGEAWDKGCMDRGQAQLEGHR